MSAPFPPPDATREQVEAWLLDNDPRWADVCAWCDHARRAHRPRRCKADGGACACDEFTEHEAPPIANGPSLVCNSCSKIRIDITAGPFCRRCSSVIEGATGVRP